MMKRRLGKCRSYGCAVFLAGAVVIAGVGGGCTGEIASGEPGSGDGGGGVDSGGPGIDSGGCTQGDCAGLAAPALAKVCADGTSFGATLCTRQADGRCDWGFPPCPADAGHMCPGLGCFPNCPNGVLKDSSGCDTCQCAPAADAGGDEAVIEVCASDVDCPSGRICGFLESAGCAGTGQCFPAPTGPRCAIASAVGCGCNGTDVSIDPSCYSGLPAGYVKKPVLHQGICTTDAGGSTQDGGGACVSPQGGPCGGNTAHPCTCAAGLTCTPGDSGLPFGDVGGTCQ